MPKKPESLNDLTPDKNNANRGTVRGLAMLEDSIQQYGAGRAILVDEDGNVIAGNKTLQAAVEAGLELVVVPTDGTKLVVVQRTDLNLYRDKRARELATADNRVAETDLEWDIAALLADTESGLLEIDKFFDQDELAILLSKVDDNDWSNALGDLPTGGKPPFEQITFTLSTAQAELVKRALKKALTIKDKDTDNANRNGNALYRICHEYLRG